MKRFQSLIEGHRGTLLLEKREKTRINNLLDIARRGVNDRDKQIKMRDGWRYAEGLLEKAEKGWDWEFDCLVLIHKAIKECKKAYLDYRE